MGPLGAQRCPVCGALLPRGTLAAAAHVEGCLGGGGTCPGPSVQRQQASLGRFFGSLAKQKVQGPAPEGAGGGVVNGVPMTMDSHQLSPWNAIDERSMEDWGEHYESIPNHLA